MALLTVFLGESVNTAVPVPRGKREQAFNGTVDSPLQGTVNRKVREDRQFSVSITLSLTFFYPLGIQITESINLAILFYTTLIGKIRTYNDFEEA